MGKVKKPKVVVSKSYQTTQSSLKNDNFLSFDPTLKNLKKNTDKVKSVALYKSSKSHKSVNKKIIKKKDKLNIKRKLLMKKIDVVHEKNKQTKLREKRKHISIMGDTNPLHDALPSLESLIKNKPNSNHNLPKEPKIKKGIEKARQRKNRLINDIAVFKKTMKDMTFASNQSTHPFEIISNYVQSMVLKEHGKINKVNA